MRMRKLAAAALVTSMAVSMLAGCGGSGKTGASSAAGSSAEAGEGGIREYTAFFAVPGDEINDDNEIQQKIAEITGARVKETWLTGQTAAEAVGTLIAGGEYPDLIDGTLVRGRMGQGTPG